MAVDARFYSLIEYKVQLSSDIALLLHRLGWEVTSPFKTKLKSATIPSK